MLDYPITPRLAKPGLYVKGLQTQVRQHNQRLTEIRRALDSHASDGDLLASHAAVKRAMDGCTPPDYSDPAGPSR
jgi:hypothetical protein